MNASGNARRTSTAGVALTVAIVVGSLYFAREVFIPIALALLLSFLLAPLVLRLRRLGLGRIPSVILAVGLAFAGIFGVGWLVAVQAADVAGKLPYYKDNVVAKLDSIRSSLRGVQRASQAVEEITQEIVGSAATAPATSSAPATLPASPPPSAVPELLGPPAEPLAPPAGAAEVRPVPVRVVSSEPLSVRILRYGFGPLLSPLGTAAIVIVFAIFMLIQREDLRDRLMRLIGSGQIHLATEALDEAASGVSRYLVTLFIINGTHGTAVAIGLTLIGVPGALLWGLVSALLRFIPYVGPWIAALLPITLSFAVYDGWQHVLMVIGLFLLIELLSNNVLEPLLYGTRTGASPLAILVSALVWTWLWGAVGLVLATPLTVCLVVIGKYVPQLEFLTILLGDQPVLSRDVRLYQRLLALDRAEAAEILEEAHKQLSVVQLYDQIILPALRQMESDRHRGTLGEQREEYARASVLEFMNDLGEWYRAERAAARPATAPPEEPLLAAKVLCVPARDETDALIGRLLAQLLEIEGLSAEVLSADTLAGELIERIQDQPPTLICISALPPSTVAHARYLHKRLAARLPGLPVVIALWTARVDPEQVGQRFAAARPVDVVTTVEEAVRLIRARAFTGAQRPRTDSAPLTGQAGRPAPAAERRPS